MAGTKTTLSVSLPFLLLLIASVSGAVSVVGRNDSGPSRIDLLERRIETLEQLAWTQSEAIEQLLRRSLRVPGDASTIDDGCLPKRNSENVCVYDDDVEFLFQNASLVFDSSTVRFTGPILEFNPTYCEGNVTTNVTACQGNATNLTTSYDFSSRVVFEYTDLVVKDSNMSISAEHKYTSYETNTTSITEHFGFLSINNTNVALNSSRFLVTSPDPRNVNRSLYDSSTYDNLFSSVGFSFATISIDDSITTFTTNSSSGTDESSIVFNHTKISYNHTEVSYTGSSTSASDSSVSYGENTNVQWYGDSSAVYFTNGVEINMDKSNVVLDDTPLELKGDEGRFVTRVESHVRGPSGGDPIDFVVSKRVNVRFEQTPTMIVETDVDVLDGSEITVDEGAALVIDGKLESNGESEFRGDIHMVDVELTVDGNLVIDGDDDNSNNADIEFRRNVDVRFFNDLRLDRNLDVAGRTNLEGLDVADEATMRGRLYCRKGATISGDTGFASSITSMYSSDLLKVEGSIHVQRDLEVDGILTSGTHTFEGDVIMKGSARASSLIVDSTARVSGTTTLGTLQASSGSITGQITAGSGSFRDIDVRQKATVGVIDATNATLSNELRARDAVITVQLTSRTIKAESDIVFENLDVSGRTTVRNLDVTGTSRLYSLSVSGNANVGGTTTLGRLTGNSGTFTGQLEAGSMKSDSSLSSTNLEVSGETKTGSLFVTSDASVGGDLNVVGSTELDSTVFVDLTVLGTASIDTISASTATISGAANVDTLTLNGNAAISGNLNVGGSTDLADTTLKNLVASGTASISGAATVQMLTVNANANVVGDLSIEGITELDDTTFRNLNVLGRATVGSLSASSASISGDASVQTLTVNANAKVEGNLDVDGSTELADTVFNDINILGNLAIAGKGTMGSLDVTSNAKIGGDLSVDGTTEFDSTVFADLTVLGTASVDSLSASSASISGLATIKRLSVDSDADVEGNLNVGGSTELAATVFQDISVLGTASMDSLSASSATISGLATIQTIAVTADATVGGGLSVDGSMELDDTTFRNINVLGRATMDSLATSSAVISGTATIEALTVNGNTNVGGGIDVAGAMELQATVFQNIEVLGTATINSLSASSAGISGTLSVDNDAIIGGDLNVRDAIIGGDLNVAGSTELAATIFQDISVLGTATVDALSASSASISGALTVDSDVNIGGGLNVAGTMKLDDTTFRNINVLGRATVDSLSASSAFIKAEARLQRLIVDTNAEVGGDLNVEGFFAATSREASFNNVAIAGTAVVGAISATNSTLRKLNVTGNATVMGNLDVVGDFANF